MLSRLDKVVEVIGVPMDFGANIRGASLGPAAVRIAGLHRMLHELHWGVHDEGDLAVPVLETLPPPAAAEKYLSQVAAVCRTLSERCRQALAAKRLPLSLGGDHSMAIGSISGVSQHFHERGERLGLIWFDAHADINTPATSPTGNIHGMPLAVVLGQGHASLCGLAYPGPKVRPQNVALVGARAIDADERRLCKASGIRYYTMREVDERGIPAVMQEAIAVASAGTAGIHLSFDLDGVDPLYAPGVSTPVSGGLSYREAHLALEMLADTGLLTAMDFVELNPLFDRDNKSAQLMVELIQSALGKSII